MSRQVWVSDEAYEYLSKLQGQILADGGKRLPLGVMASKAILNNVVESK